MTLETQVERFNTRQLFRSIWNSSVVSSLRFGCAGLANHLHRFAASRPPAWSPIVKLKRSYSRPLDSDSLHVVSSMVLAPARDSDFTARTGLQPADVIVTPQ